MEQKKERSIFKTISIIYFVWMILYFSGTLILKATNLEYRMWVWTLGNCSLFLGLPVWLFLVWFRWHVRREGIRVLRIFVTVVFSGVFLIWSGFCFLAMVFAVQEEHRLFGGYDRYGRTVPVSPAHPELPIHVSLAGRELEDDYTYLLTSWYTAEGCRELGIDRAYEVDEYGDIHFWLYGEEDIKAAASDAQKLAAYAMQDEIYQDYHGVIRFLPEDAESIYETIYIYFGKVSWEKIDIGEDFTVEYNARGGEYYMLGEDGTYQYTLVYDRDSKNGACRLYVLYRSPFDVESGTYYYYTDMMTQIADVYAVVIDTGEIIASGRTSWSDPGSGAYRDATGE